MARITRHELIKKIYDTGIIPVFYHGDEAVCRQVVAATHRGGMNVFEFTNRGDGAFDLFKSLLKYVTTYLPEVSLGVGSVYDAPLASAYIQAGADFVVSPILNAEVATVCHRRKILWVPGCGSLTEISNAEALGAEIVKIFPASAVGGPAFVKAVLGPSPWTSIMPTGGVTMEEDNLRAWLTAGVKAVGMGSKLITKDILKNKDYDLLARNAEAGLALFKSIKKELDAQ